MKFVKKFYLAFVVIAVSIGCSSVDYQVLRQRRTATTAVLTGKVGVVISGQVNTQYMFDIDSKRFLFGLGTGTFDKLEDIGECMLIAGKSYIKLSNKAKIYELVSGTALKTPFFTGIDIKSKPAQIILVNEPASMEEIYQEITDYYQYFFIAGIGYFNELSTTALKKAPIYREKIILPEYREKYFHPVGQYKNVPGVFGGIVCTTKVARINPTQSQRMFYINFDNTVLSELTSHTHVALVDDFKLGDVSRSHDVMSIINARKIKDVQHLLTQSRLRQGVIMIYPINKIKEIP